MNITKQRLKQIIKEEIQRINELEIDLEELEVKADEKLAALSPDQKEAIEQYIAALQTGNQQK